jgi:hypothetical protein
MEKLTFEHLAPYLPYKLNIVFDNKIKGELYGIGLQDLVFDLTVIELNDENQPIYKKWCLLDTKPILRPLSDLDLSIFTTMVRNVTGWKNVVSVITNKYFAVCEYESDEDSNGLDTQEQYLLYSEESDTENVISIREPKPNSVFDFNVAYGTSDEMRYFMNYKTIMMYYNQLFKYHFDVFGLIEKGLAIDINTIK